jgi:hypothetical protein
MLMWLHDALCSKRDTVSIDWLAARVKLMGGLACARVELMDVPSKVLEVGQGQYLIPV